MNLRWGNRTSYQSSLGASTREQLAAEVARPTGMKRLDDKLKGSFGDLLKPAACAATSTGT